jgi:hypothetical protein
VPFPDSLLARGIISPAAMQNLLQSIGNIKNPLPFESGGAAGTSSVYVPRGYGEKVISPDYGAPALPAPNISSRPGINRYTTGWNDETVGKFKQMLEAGSTYPQIAKELGTTLNAVKKKAGALGIKSQNRGRPVNIPDDAPDWFKEEMKQ